MQKIWLALSQFAKLWLDIAVGRAGKIKSYFYEDNQSNRLTMVLFIISLGIAILFYTMGERIQMQGNQILEELQNLTLNNTQVLKHVENVSIDTQNMVRIGNSQLKTVQTFANYLYEISPKSNYPCKPHNLVSEGYLNIEACDIIFTNKVNFSGNGYQVGLEMIPFWNESYTNYILDISGTLQEKNRISLFRENNYVKIRIYDQNGNEQIIKKPFLFHSGENYYILLKWNQNVGVVKLDINDVSIIEQKMNFTFSSDDWRLYIGSDAQGRNQGVGRYNFIFVAPYGYPEPIVIVGPQEQNI